MRIATGSDGSARERERACVGAYRLKQKPSCRMSLRVASLRHGTDCHHIGLAVLAAALAAARAAHSGETKP